MGNPHEIDAQDPLDLFDAWLTLAQESEPNDPNATALATSTVGGEPSVRMVLAKRVRDWRFCFFHQCRQPKGHATR